MVTDPRLTSPRPAYRGIALIAGFILLAIVFAYMFRPSRRDAFFGEPRDTATPADTVRTP